MAERTLFPDFHPHLPWQKLAPTVPDQSLPALAPQQKTISRRELLTIAKASAAAFAGGVILGADPFEKISRFISSKTSIDTQSAPTIASSRSAEITDPILEKARENLESILSLMRSHDNPQVRGISVLLNREIRFIDSGILDYTRDQYAMVAQTNPGQDEKVFVIFLSKKRFGDHFQSVETVEAQRQLYMYHLILEQVRGNPNLYKVDAQFTSRVDAQAEDQSRKAFPQVAQK